MTAGTFLKVPDLWSVGDWDRLAASVVSAKLPFMYSTSGEGVVLRPEKLEGGLLCCYPKDANSMGQLCEEGSGKYAASELADMLKAHSDPFFLLRDDDSCLWKDGHENRVDRSNCRYNELVLSGAVYTSALPAVIQAFFYPVNGPVHHREGDSDRAKKAHQLFLGNFPEASAVPLLTYDVALARAGEAPFRLEGAAARSVWTQPVPFRG